MKQGSSDQFRVQESGDVRMGSAEKKGLKLFYFLN